MCLETQVEVQMRDQLAHTKSVEAIPHTERRHK